MMMKSEAVIKCPALPFVAQRHATSAFPRSNGADWLAYASRSASFLQRWLEVRRTVYVHFFPRAKCEHTSLRGLF